MKKVSVEVPGWFSGVIVGFVAVGLCSIIWALVDQNRELKSALAREGTASSANAAFDSAERLAKGDTLGSVQLIAADGKIEDLAEVMGDNGGVLAVLTTTCPYCLETLPVWEELYETLDAQGIPFIGISLHDRPLTDQYVQQHAIPYRVWSLANIADSRELRIRAVPVTVVYSGAGDVASVWNGLLNASQVPAVARVARGSVAVAGREPK